MGTADKTYYLVNGEVTTDEPESGIVLINEGQEIPKEMADQYGIGKVAQQEEATENEAVEEKSAAPSANKSKKPTQNKGVK